jgi:uncharacterized protein YjbI with pentapeptide repeats
MPVKREGITPPSLPPDLVRISSPDLFFDEDIIDVVVSGVHLVDGHAERLSIRSSRLDSVTLLGCQLRGLEAKDLVFESCDLSGSDLSESRLLRVEFRNCRLSGTVLSMSTFKDVRFTDCKLDGINLRMSEAERVWILDSNMREADFYAAKFRLSRILRTDLSGSEFSQADLRGTYLQGSLLDRAKGAASLQGVVVDTSQAMLLSELLLELHDISVQKPPDEM